MSDQLADHPQRLGFSNTDVALADLPKAASVRFNPLAKNFHLTAVVMWALTVLVVAAGAVILILASDKVELETLKSEITLAVLVVMTLSAWWNIRELKMRGYAIREHDVIYKKGLVWRRVQVVPYVRVQHVETHRGPIERLFGLSSLKIFTAGGMSADMVIPGLTVVTGSNLRASILRSVTAEAEDAAAAQAKVPPSAATPVESDRAFAGETADTPTATEPNVAAATGSEGSADADAIAVIKEPRDE